MTRVLVIRRGGLGDTLLAAPLLRALRRAHAGAEVHVAGTREHCDVLAAYGIVDVARSAEDLMLWLPDRARERLRSFDVVIGDEPPVVQHVLEPKRVAPRVSFGLQLARQVGCEPEWPADAQLLPPRASNGAGVVALAPGSGGAAKCWPRARWLELAQRVAARGRELLVVVGPVELERDDPRRWPWPDGVTFCVEPEPFRLAKRLEGVGAFVGNDSGTTHLAAMLGVPTAAVFQASDAAVWAPVGEHVLVVDGDGAPPPVAQVDGALRLLP